jgi:hypothetical protein
MGVKSLRYDSDNIYEVINIVDIQIYDNTNTQRNSLWSDLKTNDNPVKTRREYSFKVVSSISQSIISLINCFF